MDINIEKELLFLQLKGYELDGRTWQGINSVWFHKADYDFYENSRLFDATYFECVDKERNIKNSINELKSWILKNSN